jgi:hypothetical protein
MIRSSKKEFNFEKKKVEAKGKGILTVYEI